MNKIKAQLDMSFRDYELTRSFDELLTRYKKRRRNIRMLSALCVVAVIAGLSGGVLGILGIYAPKLGLTAYAVDIGNNSNGSSPQIVADSDGVRLLHRTVYYNSKGKELTDGSSSKISFSRAVISPSPIEFQVTGDDVVTYTVRCGENGSVYNSKSENISGKAQSYKNRKSFSWLPNCKKLSSALSTDITKIPSTLVNDRVTTAELGSMLRTAADYTGYFGDTLKISATCKDGSEDSLTVRITLDEKGRYYISTER